MDIHYSSNNLSRCIPTVTF